MAKKITPAVIDLKSDLIENFLEFTKLRNIDRATLMSVLEDVFRAMIRKKYGSDENFNIIVNVEKGDLQVLRERRVVDDNDIVDENEEIALSEAQKIDPDYEIGDDVAEVIPYNDFGTRQILTAKQLLAQRIKELEKIEVYKQYHDLVGEIIVGEVYQAWRSEVLIMHDDNELILPKDQQIPKDRFKKGEMVRAIVHKVDNNNGNIKVILSRASPAFLEKLFEREVPEIADGTIAIRKTVRQPGERAKVAVETYDERVDPVGACVGMRGSRIHGIVRELRNENIDVIQFSSNPQIFLTRALTPARISRMEIDEANRHARVFVSPDQISLAIGKGGFNVKLASLLTEYEIDVYREDAYEFEEDVELDEFKDELDEWVIERLKSLGYDSAKRILEMTPEEIERRTDFELETIDKLLHVLRAEFED
jgi:N utilization substance protein A